MIDPIVADSEYQLETQGIATYKVSDGEVFVFSTALLEKLLKQSQAQGKVIVFVKARPKA
jgi:hypothetical protein